ncbi:MAG: hypothetical protein LBH24_06400, partial [Clostridiales bacterium]|nr:hypothetical protein [Clostridiales bacterium]
MKTKRVGMTALLLALVSVLALAACTNPVLPDGDPPTAAAYILAVEDIGADITLQSKDKLLLAQTIYAGLSEEDKALDKVVDAKAQYDLKKAAYDILVAEQETKDAADAFKALVEQIPATSALTTDEAHQNLIRAARESYEELGTAAKALAVAAFTKLVSAETKMAELLTRETADAFIALVDALPGTVGLNDEAAVAAAEAAYAALGETAKAYTDVAAAKLRLDGARTALTDLASANAFIALANALPGTIGLNDEAAVTAARAAYDALSDNALAADGVSVALTKLQSAESRLTVLKAAKAAADAFIELVEALPSADDLAEDSLTAIVAAENAYDALNFDAKGMTGVAAANDTLTTLRAAYNAAFSVKSIPMQADALSFTGDDLTFDAAMLTAVATFYEVAQSALGGKVKMSLYAYFADETQYGNHLFELTLDVAGQTGTVQSAVIVQALKDAYIAGDYSNGVTPDRTYKFAIRFTDLTGNPKISQSEYSPFSPGRTFTYERPLSPAEAEAQAFLALAAHIPALGDMTTDNELRQLIGAARAAYDALGGDAKALDEVQAAYAKLQSAESRLAELIADEAAQGFIALAELISDQVTLADAAAIADARTYYDANVKNNAAVADRDEVKAAYAALAAAEESLAALVIAKEIEDFLDMIEAFSDPTTQAEVEAARAYYDAMSNEAKADDAVADALIVLESAEDYWMLKDIAPETLSSFSDVMLNPDLAWRGGPGFAQGFKAKYGDASMSDAKLLTLVHFRVFVHNAGDQNTALFYYDLQAGELTALGVSRLTDIFTQNRDLLTAAPGVEASYVFILQVLDARGAADESLRVHLDSDTTACGGTFSYTKQPTAAEAEAQGFIDAVSAMPAP